ncbi:hypothetical protein IQ07DRAFT_31532 [Pyrenochaeta sp. DS3sAY3a]|nr:hypothetical protein IQ07DRAFT_31532 [Pyrenochaeta sp. DS3sAY3a]
MARRHHGCSDRPSKSRQTEYRQTYLKNHASIFTSAITSELYDACYGEGSSNRPKPVFISVGLDAFTCNTPLLSTWFQSYGDFDFDFVILTKGLATLDPANFVLVDNEFHFGLYDAQTMRQGLVCILFYVAIAKGC